MFEDPNCTDCKLYNWASHVCMKGEGNPETARLAVYIDQPTFQDDTRGRPFISEAGELLRYFFARMGIDREAYYLDYSLKCYAGKRMPSRKNERLVLIEACSKYRFATLQTMPNLKTIVTMGSVSLETFTGNTEVGKFEGMAWMPREPQVRDLGVSEIWVTYSPLYLLEKPAETPTIYRTLWRAAEKAGLEPKETKVPMYKWEV